MTFNNPEFKPSIIREGRKVKETAREEGINISGGMPEVFSQEVVPALQSRVNEAVATHRGWLEAEWEKQSALLGLKEPVPFDEALPYFQKTLEKRVKLYGRTMGKPAEALADDVGLVDTLCEQAAFDFIMSLRMSAQEGETYKNALKIASLSHWLNPMDIKRLGTKYEDVDQSVIKTAALSYPMNPDAFIDRYLGEVERLGTKYEDVDQSVIKTAALHNPKNPDAFIGQYLGEVERLGTKYEGKVDQSVISRAALSYPKNPDAFIDWFYDAEQYLLSAAPQAPGRSIVHQVLFLNAFKTKAELSELVQELK